MAKRKATTPATGAGRRSKRTKTTTSNVFVWNLREWKKNAEVTYNVSIMTTISDRKQKVVKKVLGVPGGEVYPHELETLLTSPACSRIVTPIGYSPAGPDAEHDSVLFEHSLLATWSSGRRSSSQPKTGSQCQKAISDGSSSR
jgi:hypothetical protein